MSLRAVSEVITSKGDAAGVALTPHALRHTCASDLVEGGVDLAVVRQLLGHANLNSMTIYVRASDGQIRRAVNGRRYEAKTSAPEDFT